MKKNKSPLIEIVTGVLLLILGLIMGVQLAQTNFWQNIFLKQKSKVALQNQVNLGTFWEVWQKLENSYYQIEDLDQTKMLQGAVAGLAASLGDPYTYYLPPADNQASSEELAGKFYGIGIEMGYIDDFLSVVGVLKDTPADKAGIMAGDRIMHVKDEIAGNDEDVYDWSSYEAMKIIRGLEKTPVTMTFWREGYNENQAFEVTITRDEIVVPSLKLEWKNTATNKKIAYLELSSFGNNTYDEWNQAVSQINSTNDVEGVILDLRDNSGGVFSEALHITDDFIESGGVLVSEEGRNESDNQTFVASGEGRLIGVPLVVLVNGNSASSAEITAGALRDQEVATLVGAKTFGKGLVQERIELGDGGGLHVTIAKWKLPGGEWIQGNGITPDIEIEDNLETETDEILDKALTVFN